MYTYKQQYQINNSMELSPSQQADSCTYIQEILKHFMKPKGSLSCIQDPSINRHLEPNQSRLHHPIISL
jgi:hypothetical protein